MGDRWLGGQSGRIPLPINDQKNQKLEYVDNNDDDIQYSFVQLCDTQLGMMSAMRQSQWKRPFVRLMTCGTLVMPPLLEEACEAVHDPQTYALNDEALHLLEQNICIETVKTINNMIPSPAFVVICGDLVNAFPSNASVDPNNSTDLHNIQKAQFKSIFSQLRQDIPLVCLCGNHDIGERPTANTVEAWRRSFGKDYFKFKVGPDLFIVINSQLYKDGSGAPDMASEQDMWLNETLKHAKQNARHIIVFSHIPPFIESPEEPSGYFPLPTPIRLSLLSRIAEAGGSHWFAGHYHRNAGGFYHHKNVSKDTRHHNNNNKDQVLEVVTTAAVGGNISTDPNGDVLGLTGMKGISLSNSLSGFRMVNVSNKGITHYFQSMKKCEPCSSDETTDETMMMTGEGSKERLIHRQKSEK